MSQVLMVDSADLFRLLEGSFLRRGGWGIVRARDTDEVLTKARRQLPDLILLEAERPDIDGSACLDRLKSDPRLSAIPVLIVTTGEKARMYQQAGADLTLTRPIESQTLEQALCSLGKISNRDGRRANVSFPVRVASSAGARRGRAKDLSRSGLFLTLARPLPLQTRIEVTLLLPMPGGTREVTVRGVVVRQVDPDPDSHLIPGVGIRFEEMDGTTRSLIDRYVDGMIVGDSTSQSKDVTGGRTI